MLHTICHLLLDIKTCRRQPNSRGYLKKKMSWNEYCFWRFSITFNSLLSVYALIVFKVIQKFFTVQLYINKLFVLFFEITNSENAYWNHPKNYLLCDWSLFYNVDTSLAVGKLSPKFNYLAIHITRTYRF
jgi:hypothetical protein